MGIKISERTVSRVLRRPRGPPSHTWRAFLTNHVATLVSMDCFAVPTLTGWILFVLVALHHHRRRIAHMNVTEHPTAAWTAQQMIEAKDAPTPRRMQPPTEGRMVAFREVGGYITATNAAPPEGTKPAWAAARGCRDVLDDDT